MCSLSEGACRIILIGQLLAEPLLAFPSCFQAILVMKLKTMSFRTLLMSTTSNARQSHQRLRYLRHSTMAVASKTVVPFKLTDIGEGIAEVELLKWFVKVVMQWS